VTHLSDDQLMLKVASHCAGSFTELVRRHIDALHAYAYRLSGNPSLADDLVQETWVKVWTHASSYKAGKVKLSTWLHRILHNKFIDHVRKQRKFSKSEDYANQQLQAPASFEPEQQNEWRESADEFTQLLAQIPQAQRGALLLVHRQGFSIAGTAEILNISSSAAQSLLARGRRAVRNVEIHTRRRNHEH
jgi:RNA polymerase sigma-70 factor (ECF subfamily)